MRRPQLAFCMAAALAAMPGWATETRWDFRVTLDDKPIGEHRFTVSHNGAQRQVESVARYRVKVLGLTVYRYDHRSEEQWTDGCVSRLDAQTDDNGQRSEVHQQPPACAMTFAYWNPAIAGRTQLLDPGTGRLEPVQITPLPLATLDVRGAPARVRGLRIQGLKQPIDVWYQGDDWVGLDTVVDGRHLRYRLP